MKKFITRLMLLAALFVVGGGASLYAQSSDFFEYDGLTYEVMGGNEVRVSRFVGYPTEVSIPSVVSYEGMDYNVTAVGDGAFFSCQILTAVDIPASVGSIGIDAFGECFLLETVNVDAGNAAYCSVDGVLYSKDMTDLICFPAANGAEEYTVPATVTSIASHAFDFCGTLKSVTLPDGLESIGRAAFLGCYSLTSIEIPDKVSDIEDLVFSGCSSLSSVSMPDGVTIIGSDAFSDCDALVSVSIPESVMHIGVSAFSGSGLTSVEIPARVEGIGTYAFGNCESLQAINVVADNEAYCSQDGVLFTKDMTRLIVHPCGKEASRFTVPESVTDIEPAAFDRCFRLTSIELPAGLKTIGYEAFYECTGLESLVIPDGVTRIEAGLFDGCSRLASVDIPESVTSIDEGAFYGCSSLVSLRLPSGLEGILDEDTFGECTSLASIVIPAGVKELSEWTFGGCTSLMSVVILSETMWFDSSSFDECENIKEVFVFGNGSYEVEKEGDLMLFETSPDYVLYTFSDTPLPERWTAPASTVKLSLGGLSDKMPYTGKFPDLYIEGNTSSYKMMVDESSMTFDTTPGTHTLDSFGFWLYKEGEEANKTLVTINQPITYTIDGAGIDDAAASGIGCYPCVADDMLTVSGTVAGASLCVIDMSGAQRMSVACTDGETAVDVSGLAQGMYFVLVEDGGDVAARLRFVKK